MKRSPEVPRRSIAALVVLAGALCAWTFAGIPPLVMSAAAPHVLAPAPAAYPDSPPPPLLSVAATLVTGNSTTGNAPDPPTYDSQNGYVYLANYLARNVTIVDGLSTIASVDLPGNPAASLFDPQNGYVYVAEYNASSLTVLNGTSVLDEVSIGAPCSGVPTFDTANGFVYVPNGCTANVTVIDGTTVEGTIALPELSKTNGSIGAAYDPADGDVYVSASLANAVYVVRGTSYVATVPVGHWPTVATFDPVSGMMYVTDLADGNLSVLNNTTVVTTIPFGGPGFPGGVAYPGTFDTANGLLYVPFQRFNSNNSTVAVVNGTTVITTIETGPLIAGATSYVPYGNGTGFVYAESGESLNGGLGAGTLSAIAGTTLAGSVNFTSEPAGAVYDPANGYVYLATRTPYDLATGRISSFIVVIACSSCAGVSISEVGATSGTAWGIVVANSTTLFAESVEAVAPAPITLHLVQGLYSLRLTLQSGLTITIESENAVYSRATGTIRVDAYSPPPPPPPPGAGPHGPPLWAWLLGSAAVVGATLLGGAAISQRTVRREGEELVQGMRQALEEVSGRTRGPP